MNRLVLLLLSSASAMSLAMPAFAQTAAAPQPAPAAQPDAAPSVPDIVVTGSRVIRNGAASPTPLTTMSTQAMNVAAPAGTISDQLNSLPVFSGSRSSFSNPGANATGVQGGNGSANVLNLRNLGFYRTLVLFDGHRVPPTLYNSAVDVDVIPQELITRVDVVTGGVSAVYGSDAVSGVVNYVLDHNFNGFRMHGSSGISQYGDAANFDIGGAAGFKVGDRGHFEFSIEHRQNTGISDRAGSRSWDNLPAIEGAGTAANPYELLTNVHLAAFTFGGLITSGALKGQTFGTGSTLSKFVAGTTTGSSCCQVGGSGAYQDASMAAATKGTQAFGRFDYDISDDVHGYVQFGLNAKQSVTYTGWNQLTNVTISANNAFLPAQYQQQLAAAGQSSFTMSEIMSDAPRIEDLVNTTQIYLNAGLDGHLGKFKWNATYTHGASTMSTHVLNQVNTVNLANALNAVVDPDTGKAVCAVGGNCVPLDIFGSHSASTSALNYVLGGDSFMTHTLQDSADASLSGDLFNTWAGPVSVALSAEWRRQAFDALSDADSSQFTVSFPSSPTVSQSVREIALEGEVPLLKDVAFAKSLDLNGAARYTDYSTSGKYWTWKGGAVWEVSDALKFRATISRDIRAPTLFDLYQPTTTVYGNFTDAKTNTTAYLPSINIANPNMTAEVGHTWTAGVVLKPQFLRGTTFILDYYHTLITNAIATVQGFNAAVQQACYNGGAPSYCSLIQRDSAGDVTAYYIQSQNIAQIKTYGYDAEFDLATHVFDRPLGLRVMGNYQPHIYYVQPGVALDDQGDAGWGTNGLVPSPSVQVSAFLNYRLTQNLSVDLFEHWRNHFKLSGVAGQVFVNPYVPAFATTNLTLTFDTGNAWKIKDSQIYVSVSNLFNAAPPVTGYYSGSTSAGAGYEFTDDPTGRAFLIGFRLKG